MDNIKEAYTDERAALLAEELNHREQLYRMTLHEEMSFDRWTVMRVHMGWIYTIWLGGSNFKSSTFVPDTRPNAGIDG